MIHSDVVRCRTADGLGGWGPVLCIADHLCSAVFGGGESCSVTILKTLMALCWHTGRNVISNLNWNRKSFATWSLHGGCMLLGIGLYCAANLGRIESRLTHSIVIECVGLVANGVVLLVS